MYLSYLYNVRFPIEKKPTPGNHEINLNNVGQITYLLKVGPPISDVQNISINIKIKPLVPLK